MSREFGICGSSGNSGSGGGLTMPSYTINNTSGLLLKNGQASNTGADAAGFWTAIDLSHTAQGYETVKLAAAANTNEQTILNILDSGVLTNVVAPELSGSGTMTIKVTADGVETVYLSETITTGARFCIGAILGQDSTATATDGAGFGARLDAGFSTTTDFATLITPLQTLYLGGIGIKFETSLKVTITGSVNISGTAQLLNGCANYSLFIPEGL